MNNLNQKPTRYFMLLRLTVQNSSREYKPAGNQIGRALLQALLEKVCLEVGADSVCVGSTGVLNDSWYLFQTDCHPRLLAGIVHQLEAVALYVGAQIAITGHGELNWRTVYPNDSRPIDPHECLLGEFTRKCKKNNARLGKFEKEMRIRTDLPNG